MASAMCDLNFNYAFGVTYVNKLFVMLLYLQVFTCPEGKYLYINILVILLFFSICRNICWTIQ